MKSKRAKIEALFEKSTRLIYRNRFKTLLLMFFLIGYLASHISNLTIDTSTEEMLHASDPSRIEFNEFKKQFGNSEYSLVVIESPDIFSPAFLNRLRAFHMELEKTVPYLHKVTSLLNVRNTRGEGDTLIVDDLLKDWPEGGHDLAEVKEIAEGNAFYRDHILSENGRFTAIIVENRSEISKDDDGMAGFDDFQEESPAAVNESETDFLPSLTPAENAEINDTISAIIKKHTTDDFPIYYTGGAVIVNSFNRETEKNMAKFSLYTTLAIIAFLVLLFRRVTGVVFPLIIVSCSTLSTLGLMVISGTAISMMTTVIPAFLAAVGIADSIHVLAIFYRKYQEGETKENAVCYAMGHSGLAIVMTSMTTAAGLLSFSMAEIATIADMGIFASAGVILALIYTVILLPALIALFPIRLKHMEKEKNKSVVMDRFLLLFAKVATVHPLKVVAVSVFLAVGSVYYISGLTFTSNILNYFPDNYPTKIDLKAIEAHLQGTVGVEVIVDTGEENGIHDPAILNSLEKLTGEILKIRRDDIYVGKVTSIVDIVKEINQALHGNNPDYYTIPQEKVVVGQELFVFETSGSDDLEEVADNQFRKTRLTIKTRWTDSVAYKYFIRDIEEMFGNEFQGRATISVTGISALMGRTIPAAMNSMVKSYVIALVVITIMMFVLVGDWKFGLLSMAPNLLPIMMVMGLIRLCGLNLDINTLFIGSIAIGLVVDDTIHFMYNFKKYYNLTGDAKKAIEETLLGTGRALLITSVVLCANFFTLTTGSLNSTTIFGIFTGLVIIFALLADFLLAPALLLLATKGKQDAPLPESEEGKMTPQEHSAA